jgi:hypothetical protein
MNWLLVAFVVLFSIGFASCGGKGKAIDIVRNGPFENPYNGASVPTEELMNEYPGRIGKIKWKVEQVIKQSKEEGGTIYAVSATFDHDPSLEALFADDDGDVVNNSSFNNHITHLLYNYGSSSNDSEEKSLIEIVDKIAEMYINTVYDEYGSRAQFYSHRPSWDEINTEKWFKINSAKVNVLFISMPLIREFRPIKIGFEFVISTNLLEKNNKFTVLIETELSLYDSYATPSLFLQMFYGKINYYYAMFDYDGEPAIRNEVMDEYKKVWEAREEALKAEREEKERIAQEEKDRIKAQITAEFEQKREEAISIIDKRIAYFESFIPPNAPKDEIPHLRIEPTRGNSIEISRIISGLEYFKERIEKIPVEIRDGELVRHYDHSTLEYYLETPFEEIIPYHYDNYTASNDYREYHALVEAAGNYYRTPLSQ